MLNGNRWISVGSGTNTIAISQDGINWTALGSSVFFDGFGTSVASNPKIGPVFIDSQIVLNNNGYGLSSTLDVATDSYYNTGFDNMSVTIKSYN